MAQANGYILHHDKQAHVVIIATGTASKSANSKTGAMIQIWILRDDMTPIDAVKTGADETICGTCVHRGDATRKRSCYVNIGQAPLAIFRAFQRGSYSFLPVSEYARIFGGRAVRFGAYGDPCLIPADIMACIVGVASKHTGYTHQWRDARYSWLSQYVMASADSVTDYRDATAMGWRTFRVNVDGIATAGEIVCPASEEMGKRTTCDKCGLCAGNSKQAKNITIRVHGATAKNFVSLGAIK